MFVQKDDKAAVNNFLVMQIQMKDSNVQFDENSKPFVENSYEKSTGSLLYLSVLTRPDIAFAINRLAEFNKCLKETHFVAAKIILRYLKGTVYFSLKFSKIVPAKTISPVTQMPIGELKRVENQFQES